MDHAQRNWRVLLPDSSIQQFSVPGAFEIPLVVQEIAERGAIHRDHRARRHHPGRDAARPAHRRGGHPRAARSLAPPPRAGHPRGAALENEAQARARCLEPEINRGTEAARAAVRMIQALAEMQRRARSPMGKRREGREAAVQFLFQDDLNKTDPEALPAVLEEFWKLRESAAKDARNSPPN